MYYVVHDLFCFGKDGAKNAPTGNTQDAHTKTNSVTRLRAIAVEMSQSTLLINAYQIYS